MSEPDARRVAAGERHAALAAEIAGLGLPVPGSLVERSTRCGNVNCRCHADPPELHGPYLSWTRKVQGKTVTRTLSPVQAEQLRPMLENGRRLREIVAEQETLGLNQLNNP